jgi:class 3 adenylate cyclase/tetratricopeptide (TPR) repeat protein
VPAPQTYTPKHLAEKILAARDALQGERKQVTVLFADVVGSTELIRGRDAEDAQRLLDGVVQRMMDAVHRYEGTVSRLMGDGLMAMFGAPVAHEDHAVRACFAALAMQDTVRRYADQVRQEYGAAIQIRVGLNSGEVIVRLISDDLHMDYTAMGQTVHLASRLESLASAGSIAAGPATGALAEGLIELRPLGPTPVRGLDRPIEVFEVVGAGAARTRLQASAARGLTPFVGRENEQTAIERAFAQVKDGRGQVVALVAEAGVGKSRLVREVTRSEWALDRLVLQTGAVSYGQTTTWLPVIDLLRTYFQIQSRDDRAAMREKVSAGLISLDPALEPALPPLLALLDVPVDPEASSAEAAWAQRDPAQRRRAILDAVQQVVLRESQRQPLLLVFEDLHWIDSESQALLDALVDSLPTVQILLLVNYRPEYSHSWGGKSYYTQLRVDPLVDASAEALLGALLGPATGLQPLTSLLIQRTEGTPLFLEETVRSLVETGALVGERGAYRLARPVDEIRVPATVQTVLAARIDRLPAEEKRLLQTVAVIGTDVPFRVLQVVAERPETELQASLSRLQASELLYPTSLFPEQEYTFKHALTQEVAYDSLLQERRTTLHARVVAAVERLYPDRLDEHVERLAHHALRAEVWEHAVSYSRRAGERAMARSANREAVGHFEQALAALAHLPEHPATIEHHVDLLLSLRNALVPLGEYGRILAILRAAEALAKELADPQRMGWVSAVLSDYFSTMGDYDQAIESGELALAIATTFDELSLQVSANIFLGFPYLFMGNYRRAVHYLTQNIEALQGDQMYERFGEPGLPSVCARAFCAWGLAELGELDTAIEIALEGLRIAEASDDGPFTLGHAYLGVGIAHLRKGELEPAIAALDQGRQICQVDDAMFPWIASHLGYAYALAARVGEARPMLELALEHAPRLAGIGQGLLMSELALLAQRGADARQLAERGLMLAHEHRQRGEEAYALRVLGEIAARGDPPDVAAAETHYRAALTLAEQLEMRPLQAHCHLGLGKLYRRVERSEEARANLSTAIAMLREMGMAFWLPEAERELAEAEG